ncbi:hypothetical protein [Micromonospora haikouensis]|uniref:hypothetical protein n=1 Tax=Micromonospora haikouensis TaxID=686309 RepID=UPI003D70F491
MSETRSDEELFEQADELIRQLELVSVTFDRAAGEIRNRSALDIPSGQDVPTHVTLMLAHRFDEEGLTFKHDAKVAIGASDEDADDAAAIVEASIVVQFRAESPLVPDHERALALGQTHSHRVMYPYLRELVQSMLARLGVSGATLGLFKAVG